jgi:alkylhydroperoxidase family enzyme
VPTHIALGRSAGLTEDEISHVADDVVPNGVFDEAERAVQRYVVLSTSAEPITDEVYEALRAHLSERQVIDLCFTVGLANLVNRFHATFHTDVDEATLAGLGEPPLELPPRRG